MEVSTDQTRSYLLAQTGGTFKVFDMAAAAEPVFELQPEQLVDSKYRIIRPIGQGGMGAVYEAYHVLLNKTVALKTFRLQEYAQDARERFVREAQAIAKIKHLNVVSIFDFGFLENGIPYYTMEFLRGETLAQRIKRKPLKLEQTVAIVLQVCAGLGAAHAKGVVHRDLKPGNLFIDASGSAGSQGAIKLVDFGIASLGSAAADQQRLTQKGSVIGSPMYLCPELAMGNEVDARGDIYSLACVVWEMLVGSPPFKGSTSFETIMMHMSAPRPLLRQAENGSSYSAQMEHLLRTMMDVDPRKRPSTVKQVADQFPSAIEQGKTDHRSEAQERPVQRTVEDDQTSTVVFPAKLGLILGISAVVVVAVSSMVFLGGKSTKLAASKQPSAISQPAANSLSAVHPSHSYTELGSDLGLPAADLPSVDYYSLIEVTETPIRGGDTLYQLTYPAAFRFGTLKPVVRKEERASDTVLTWRKSYRPIFEPSPEFEREPRYFQKIPKESIGGILFRDFHDTKLLHDNITQAINFRGMDQLTFWECDMPAVELHRLDAISGLGQLKLRSTGVQAKDLLTLAHFNEYDGIGYGGVDAANVKTFLAHLKNSKRIKYLYLPSVKFESSDDFDTILTLKHLECLELRGTNVTTDQIKKLIALPKLKMLDLQDVGTSDQLLPTFQHMAAGSLRILFTDQDNWNPIKTEALKRIPNLEVRDSLSFVKSHEMQKDFGRYDIAR